MRVCVCVCVCGGFVCVCLCMCACGLAEFTTHSKKASRFQHFLLDKRPYFSVSFPAWAKSLILHSSPFPLRPITWITPPMAYATPLGHNEAKYVRALVGLGGKSSGCDLHRTRARQESCKTKKTVSHYDSIENSISLVKLQQVDALHLLVAKTPSKSMSSYTPVQN